MKAHTKACGAGLLIACIFVSSANAQQYSAVDLYPLEGTEYVFVSHDITAATGGQVAGARVFIGPVFVSALMWNGPNGGMTPLWPLGDGGFSRVNAIDGDHQVGFAYGFAGNDDH